MQIPEIVRFDRRGRPLEERSSRCSLRKCNDVAQRVRAGEKHGDAVHAKRKAAVGRRPRTQPFEEKAESVLRLFVLQAEQAEDLSLKLWITDAQTPATELGAVQDHIVGQRTSSLRRRVQQKQVVRVWRR